MKRAPGQKLPRTYLIPLSTRPLVCGRYGRHSRISKPTRSPKSRNCGVKIGSPPSSRPSTTTLALSYKHRRGTPPSRSNALAWQRRKVARSARRTNSTYSARDQLSTSTKAQT